MKTLMRARLHLATASGTPSRGGSIREKRPTKGEVLHDEVALGLGGEGEVVGVAVHLLVGESEDALSHAAESLVGLGVLCLPLGGQVDLLSVDHDLLAHAEDALGGALEVQVGDVAAVLVLVDGHLPLVGGVELDLEDLGAGLAALGVVGDHLRELDEAGLGGRRRCSRGRAG